MKRKTMRGKACWAGRVRAAVLLLLLCLCSFGPAGAQRFTATVVDAGSRETLPFASVYVNGRTATITNLEGAFSIECDSADVLRISYVGYKTAYVRADRMGHVVALSANETLLQEVVVVPIAPMINKITKETLRQLRNYSHKKSEFYYRQTAFSDSTCYEFAESFLTGCPAVTLSKLRLLTGRYAGLQPDSLNFYNYFGNFYTFSQVEVAANYVNPRTIDDVVPLFRNYDKYYDVYYHVIAEDDGRVFVIRFEPKPESLEKNYSMLAATLYVDEKTLHLRRIVGEGRNYWIVTRQKTEGFAPILGKYEKYVKNRILTSTHFDVHLNDTRGFSEVRSVYVEDVHQEYGVDSLMPPKTVTTRSLLFNLGTEKEARKRNIFQRIGDFLKEQTQVRQKGESLNFNNKLHEKIESQGYDPEFWNKNEIVRRTPIEQEVLELFQQKNLFGLMEE